MYIERKAAIKALFEAFPCSEDDAVRHCVCALRDKLKTLPAASVAEREIRGMRIEVKDLGRGRYSEYCFCPGCGIEIGHKSFDHGRLVGHWTVLYDNEFPNFCPACGQRIII